MSDVKYTEEQWNREIGWGTVPDEYRHSNIDPQLESDPKPPKPPNPDLRRWVLERLDFDVEESAMGDGSITVAFSHLFKSTEEAERMVKYLTVAVKCFDYDG